MALVRQNGREWKYHLDVALRNEFIEHDTILWLRDVIQPGDCILDIGANVGQVTLEAAVLTGLGGKVVAIEPAPGNLRLLFDHVAANGVGHQVEIVPAACGAAHDSQITLRVHGADPNAIGAGHNTVGRSEAGPSTEVAVAMVSVDGLCRDRNFSPAVIKIDVEGAELEVLKGCVQTLARYRPRVRVGFHPFAFLDPRTATAAIRDLFISCGYDAPTPGPSGAYCLDEYSFVPKPAVGS